MASPASALPPAAGKQARSVRTVPDRPTREAKVRPATDDQARAFARCRTLGHRWDDVGWADPLTRPPSSVSSWNARGWVSRCVNCQCERTKWLTRYGTTTLNTYRHVDGYLRHGEDRLSNPEWRRTWIVSMLGDDA